MFSGVGHLHGFDDWFQCHRRGGNKEIFPVPGVIVPTMPWNWIQWGGEYSRDLLLCNCITVR